MAQKTLQNICGNGASETATTITIIKSEIGLTGATTTADQFLAAVVIKAESEMTQDNFQLEIAQNLYITDGFPTGANKDSVSWMIRQKVVNFGKPSTEEILDPNTY
jgi:hypothetical protein